MTFDDMWRSISFWAAVSLSVVYVPAVLYSFYSWRKHSIGRFYGLLMIIGALFGGISAMISAAVIPAVTISLGWEMTPMFAIILGILHVVISVIVQMTRIPATL